MTTGGLLTQHLSGGRLRPTFVLARVRANRPGRTVSDREDRPRESARRDELEVGNAAEPRSPGLRPTRQRVGGRRR